MFQIAWLKSKYNEGILSQPYIYFLNIYCLRIHILQTVLQLTVWKWNV